MLQVLLYAPFPANLLEGSLEVGAYAGGRRRLDYSSFVCFYLVYNRYLYLINFYIHSQLYYGSRTDRIARLYTIRFGTFNAIKFLIN